jgi:uncharacterized protein YdeI (YjbR/CyaY-like superfamily)
VSPKPELPTIQLPDAAAWEVWLEANHPTSNGVWLMIAKKASPHETVTYPDVLDVAICFGWIDGQRRPHDEHFFLQRFTPRGPRSKWSQVNRDKAAGLIQLRRMRPAGQAQIDAAKRDGRWADAYEPQSRATVPADLQRALDQNPDAKAFFGTLSSQNRYSFIYRLRQVKSPERRAKRIADYVAMLEQGKAFYP